MACGYSISMFFHMRNRLKASVWASDEYFSDFRPIFHRLDVFAVNMKFLPNNNYGKWVLYLYVFPREKSIKSISLDLTRTLIDIRPHHFDRVNILAKIWNLCITITIAYGLWVLYFHIFPHPKSIKSISLDIRWIFNWFLATHIFTVWHFSKWYSIPMFFHMGNKLKAPFYTSDDVTFNRFSVTPFSTVEIFFLD